MAMTMSKRERVLLFAVVVLGMVAVVYNLGLKGVVASLGESRDQLRQAETTYKEYIKYLTGRGLRAQKVYQAFEQHYPMGEELAKGFTSKIERAFKTFGMRRTTIDPFQIEAVEGLEDYGFVTLHVSCIGDITKVAQMLKFFDKQAILVKELKLAGTLDKPDISIDVTVSQIVKLSEEMKKTLEEERTGRRRSRPRRSFGI